MAILTLITLFATSGRPEARRLDRPDMIAAAASPSHMGGMKRRRRRKPHPLLRQALFLTGVVLIIVSPLVGAIPGPGGVVVFAAGLALILKNSEWAKRQYVRFKRRHPNKGRWADWGMRRQSARRREAMSRGGTADARPIEGGAGPAAGD